MNTKLFLAGSLFALALGFSFALGSFAPATVRAQSTSPTPSTSCTSTNVTENFTGNTTNCSWNFINGACLTAGTTPHTGTSSPGQIPMCANLPYYGTQTQLGGNTGNANQDTASTGGALRLTNGGSNLDQSGAIISNVPFSLSSAGLQVTFTTETYIGNSDSNSPGGDSDGADGISFFLQDASQPVTLGDFGGSLGYTCSNTNDSTTLDPDNIVQGYDGMVGAYIGLGIDEFGNFLDGGIITSAIGTNPSTTSVGTSSSNSNPITTGDTQDNTSTGYGKLANRVGLRGAGSTAWYSLSTNAATSAYYPLTLNAAQRLQAVWLACETGFAWNFSGSNMKNPSGNNSTPTQVTVGGHTEFISNPYGATPEPTVALPNYAVIPNGYAILSHPIANEGAKFRGYATPSTSGSNYGVPITYDLTITTGGLLSLSYSYNGGNFQPIISGQDITTANGALPSQVRFGFAGSTGGGSNIHEIMCFQAQPTTQASSSAGLNQKQTAKVQTGTQVYFAFYNSNNWTGSLTSQNLVAPTGEPNELEIDPVVNWDASCVLTGTGSSTNPITTCASTGQPNVAAESPTTGGGGRIMLTYNNGGIPFTWTTAGATGLSTTEQSNLNFDDPTPSSTNFPSNSSLRLNFLRGVRSDEQNVKGLDPNMTTPPNPSGFRARTSVLGDIVDSSPTWVGAPSSPYPATWADDLFPTVTMPENAGPTTLYSAFANTYAGRTNVVYAGSNDGFMHGFRTGSFTGTTFNAANNDGHEILAYMPAYVVNTINSSAVAGSSPAAPNAALDYTNPLYAHKFSVDATPGTGDVFYNGAWHTWLVGGLGAGGSAIFALDITNPDNGALANPSFSESNASSIVMGEWSSSIQSTSATNPTTGVVTTTVTGGTATFSCAVNVTSGTSGASTCGNSLGKTYGTPQIRRFHNNPASGPTTSWGAVFGNGSGSYNGDAGIYVMLISNTTAPSPPKVTFYYLSTGVGSRTGTPNGIYYVSTADLDGDHIVDYVYAGDLQGNIWRFDLTSSNPANWAVTSATGNAMTTAGAGTPIYNDTIPATPASGSNPAVPAYAAPITTKLVVASIASTSTNPRVLVEFGTGQQAPFTNLSPATYATAQQELVGIWDWNLSGWNAKSTAQYDSLTSSTTPRAPTSTITGLSSLQQQSVLGTFDSSGTASSSSTQTGTAFTFETISSNPINWADTSTTGTAQFGWYLQLSSGYGNSKDANGLLSSSTVAGAAKMYEQVIFSPTLQDGAFIVNTTIPPSTSLATCSSTAAGGWTMAINAANGGSFTNSVFGTSNHTFLDVDNEVVSGIALSGTGTPSVVQGGTNTFLVTQTTSGTGNITQLNLPGSTQGSRITWIEKR